jgi:hypothetical protein
MSTHRRTWQIAEGRAPERFGSKRQVFSGSSRRDDATYSDSTHPTLFVESKLRARHTTRVLHDQAKRRAAREHKTPVLCLLDKNRPGCLVVLHSGDLADVLAEYAAALDGDERAQLEAALRRAHSRQRGEELEPAEGGP